MTFSEKFLKFYYAIVSSVSLIVIGVNIWMIASDILAYYLISNDEYIARYSWEFERCKDKTLSFDRGRGQKIDKSEEEIQECIQNTKNRILLQRRYDLKQDLIRSISLVIAFLIVFVFHYSKLKDLKEE